MPTRRQIFKRLLLVALALLGVICVIVIATPKAEPARYAPRFVSGVPVDAITNLSAWAYYDSSADIPFQGDRVWLSAPMGFTNSHTYWAGLDDLTIKGELLRGLPVFCNNDRTKLFCRSHDPSFPALKRRLAMWIEKLSGGKWSPKPNPDETFWILDLRNNQAKRIGSFPQTYALGGRWHPAPGFRFGYNIPTASPNDNEFYLCDLEQEKMTLVHNPPGSIQGWWDDHRLLITDAYDFSLYDVITRQTTNLFTATQLQQFLKQSNLPDRLDAFAATQTWTDDGYTFHFSARTTWPNGSYYVLKLKPGEATPALKVFHGGFQLEWLGRFNSDDTLYLFPGERGRRGEGGDGSVHIRDERTGEERILIARDQSSQYTLPRFYKNRIIYTKSRQLWSIDLNGSNNFKLFQLP